MEYTCLDIIKSYLTENGYDGLYNSNVECACELSDLAPCGDISATYCAAGYKQEGCTESCGAGCDFHICKDKPTIV